MDIGKETIVAKVRLLQITQDAERHIEYCTRICYNSIDKMTGSTHVHFLPACLKRGHFSVLSHAHASIHVSEYSRAATHQHVRHAHLRYLQRSQRYCKEDEATFILPPEIQNDEEAREKFIQHTINVSDFYSWLIGKGVKQEDARYALPNACSSSIVTSGTLQAWWDFLRLRLAKKAQWEIREVAKKIYVLLNSACPNIFNPELLVVQPKLNLEFPEEV